MNFADNVDRFQTKSHMYLRIMVIVPYCLANFQALHLKLVKFSVYGEIN